MSAACGDQRKRFVKTPDHHFDKFSLFEKKKKRCNSAAAAVSSRGASTVGRREQRVRTGNPSSTSKLVRPAQQQQQQQQQQRRAYSAFAKPTHAHVNKPPSMLRHNSAFTRATKHATSANQSSRVSLTTRETLQQRPSSTLRSGMWSPMSSFDDWKCDRNPKGAEGAAVSRETSSLAREHCDVLGVTACGDCMRVRDQSRHQQQCMAQVPGDILEVYDQAVIQEVFPHLSLREVELKLQRGEICSEPYRGGVVTSGDDGGDQTDIYHKSSTYLTYFNPSSANQKATATSEPQPLTGEQTTSGEDATISSSSKKLNYVALVEQKLNESRRKRANKRTQVIPSDDFFTDFKDFTEKVHLGGRLQSRARDRDFIRNLSKKPSIEVAALKQQGGGSRRDVDYFSPPILCNNRVRYLGVQAPTVGVRASLVKPGLLKIHQ